MVAHFEKRVEAARRIRMTNLECRTEGTSKFALSLTPPSATTTNRPFASRALNRAVGAWAKSAGHCSWGVAPGWNDDGPLALNGAISTTQVIEELIKLAELLENPAAPTARLHPSLGQRPRLRIGKFPKG
jgi:hypothetical protein